MLEQSLTPSPHYITIQCVSTDTTSDCSCATGTAEGLFHCVWLRRGLVMSRCDGMKTVKELKINLLPTLIWSVSTIMCSSLWQQHAIPSQNFQSSRLNAKLTICYFIVISTTTRSLYHLCGFDVAKHLTPKPVEFGSSGIKDCGSLHLHNTAFWFRTQHSQRVICFGHPMKTSLRCDFDRHITNICMHRAWILYFIRTCGVISL